MGRLDGTYHIKNHIKRQGMTLQLTLGKCSSISEMAVIGLGIPTLTLPSITLKPVLIGPLELHKLIYLLFATSWSVGIA